MASFEQLFNTGRTRGDCSAKRDCETKRALASSVALYPDHTVSGTTVGELHGCPVEPVVHARERYYVITQDTFHELPLV